MVTTINGVVPGSGRCVAKNCGAHASRNALMCRPHWSQVPKPLRDNVMSMWRRWNAATANLGDVRDAQQAAAEAVSA